MATSQPSEFDVVMLPGSAQQKKINVIVTPMNSAQLRSVVQKAFELANEYKPILTE